MVSLQIRQVGRLATRRSDDFAMLTKISILFCIVATSASISLFAGSSFAGPLTAGGSYPFEIHAGENHSGRALDGIDLSFGSFATSNLRYSSLIGGVFVETDFSGTNLRDTDFSGSDLTNAIFSPAVNLSDANLTNTVLIGVDLTGVNVRNAIFVGAAYDATTILDFDPVAAGMVPVPELSPLTLVLLGLMAMAGLRTSRPLDAARASYC
jgi:hypothetical protein